MSREPASGREDVPEEPGGRGGVQGAEGQSQNRLEWGGCPAAPRGARTPVPAGRLLRGGAPVCGMRHPTSRRRCCPSPVCCPCPPTAQAGRPAAPRRLAREPFGAAGRAHGENTDCTVDSPLPGNKQTALIAALPSGLVAVGTAHGLPRASLQSGPQTGLAPGGERLRAPRAAAGPHPPPGPCPCPQHGEEGPAPGPGLAGHCPPASRLPARCPAIWFTPTSRSPWPLPRPRGPCEESAPAGTRCEAVVTRLPPWRTNTGTPSREPPPVAPSLPVVGAGASSWGWVTPAAHLPESDQRGARTQSSPGLCRCGAEKGVGTPLRGTAGRTALSRPPGARGPHWGCRRLRGPHRGPSGRPPSPQAASEGLPP